MTTRSPQQKLGARGHKFVLAQIEKHPDWLARSLDEDFGIDLEAELTEGGEVRGEIIKIQVKSAASVVRRGNNIKVRVESKYVAYARSCRFPVVLVYVDLRTNECWYLWLQDWLLQRQFYDGRLSSTTKTWAHLIGEDSTLAHGLDGPLKSVAKGVGDSSLIVSLNDALRSAAATGDNDTVSALTDLVSRKSPFMTIASLHSVIDQCKSLGDRLRGTPEGYALTAGLFNLIRRCGNRLTRTAIHDLVLRAESYSRTGVAALGILYDEHFEYTASLELPEYFKNRCPHVAYYCAFRIAFPTERSANVFVDPTGFRFAGLTYSQPDMHWDKYANRGPSAILDYLAPTSSSTFDAT